MNKMIADLPLVIVTVYFDFPADKAYFQSRSFLKLSNFTKRLNTDIED